MTYGFYATKISSVKEIFEVSPSNEAPKSEAILLKIDSFLKFAIIVLHLD